MLPRSKPEPRALETWARRDRLSLWRLSKRPRTGIVSPHFFGIPVGLENLPHDLFVLSAPAARRNVSVEIMKKTRTANRSPKPDKDMLPEYRFDYSKAKPNRFAAHLKHGSRAVILDPDVAAIFPTPESVNAVLRALIETMPQGSSR